MDGSTIEQSSAGQARPLRVMSFNVRGARFDDGVNCWPNRAALNVRVIRRHAPDLIGFQEAHQGNLDVYQQQLAGYHWLSGPAYNNDPAHYQYPAIAWNPGRLNLIESGGFWLSETPEQHSGSWDTACIRSATWAQFEDIVTGFHFIHLNTHLDHISELARVEGARLIVARLQTIAAGLPVLVTGDFNCVPGSPAHRLFTAEGYTDTFAAAGHTQPAFSYHGFLGRAWQPKPHESDRIDWILTRDGRQHWRVLACDLIEDAEPPLYPSDHWPVLCQVSLP